MSYLVIAIEGGVALYLLCESGDLFFKQECEAGIVFDQVIEFTYRLQLLLILELQIA